MPYPKVTKELCMRCIYGYPCSMWDELSLPEDGEECHNFGEKIELEKEPAGNSQQKETENNQLEEDDSVEATIVYPYSDFEFPEILPNYMELHEYLKKHNIKGGDKVIVQVRKKEKL